MIRLFPTTSFFILGSAAFMATLPALTFNGLSFSSNGPLAAAVLPDPVGASSLNSVASASGGNIQFSSTTNSGNSSTGGNSNRSSVSLNINGQNISVPENGSTQQTTTNADGTRTQINAQHNQSGDAQGSSQSSTSINIFSGSNSSVLNNEQTEN